MPVTTPRVLTGLLIWLVASALLGASGILQELKPPQPQLIGATLTLLLSILTFTVPGLRAWARDVDLRALVALHITRLVGFYFLLLYRQGELPFAFAVPGGIGDIIVALLALALVSGGALTTARRRKLVLAWNIFGLVDILLVVFTAARLALDNPASMAALLKLPLNVLPTFLVPLIIASHVIILWRLGVRRT